MRKLAILTTVLTSTIAVGFSASPASAVEPTWTTTESYTYTQDQVLYAEAYKTDTSTADASFAEYSEAQAADGRLVDKSQVHVANVFGGTAVWDNGSKIDSVGRSTYVATDAATGEQAEIQDLELIGDEGEELKKPLATAVSGSGMTGASSMTGGSLLAKYCQTWSYNGNKVTGCVEKMKPSNDGSSTRDYYAYNRWGTAEGRIIDWAPDFLVTKFDMRSRPHASYPTYTKGMSDYFPNDSAQLCAEGGSVGLGVGSLSFSIGLSNCSEKYPIPNATTKTMGLIYDAGAIYDARVKGVDYEQEVFTYQGQPAPRLGLYNYGKFCRTSYLDCSSTIGKDGW